MDLKELRKRKRKLRTRLETTEERIRVLQALLSETVSADYEARKELCLLDLGLDKDTELAFSGHECVTSPMGHCAYNVDDDLNRDFCLFCGDPQERK